jgi:hypothetical protein
MKKRTRYEIADAAVRRWCRFYELTPYFWRADHTKKMSQIFRKSESSKQIKRFGTNVKYGEPEDRADCMAMICGTLYVKGFDRNELAELLEMSPCTVWHYREHYRLMPNQTRRDLIALDGEKAGDFYESIIKDARMERIERMMQTRKKWKDQ